MRSPTRAPSCRSAGRDKARNPGLPGWAPARTQKALSCEHILVTVSRAKSRLQGHTRGSDAELLHTKQQRGPTNAEQSSCTVWTANFPNCFLQRGDDFPPFRVFEGPPQTPIATIIQRPRIRTKVQFFHRQLENESDGADDRAFDDVLQFAYVAGPGILHQCGHDL